MPQTAMQTFRGVSFFISAFPWIWALWLILHYCTSLQNHKPAKRDKPLRYAIYARYSSENQNELSIEDQIRECTRTIAAKGGKVVKVFTDPSFSGWSLNRPGFLEFQNW